jgi:hypothetical protein
LPIEVRSVLIGEVAAELSEPEPRDRYEVLEDLSRAGDPIVELMAPALFEELERRDELAPCALRPMLSILVRGLREDRPRFAELAIARFNSAGEARIGGLYLGAAFAVDSEAATDALMARLDTLEIGDQTELVKLVLPHIFGTDFRSGNVARPELSFASLERLVGIAFRTIRIEDDHNRASGQVFSPDERDYAEKARSAAFNQLVETAGRATHDAILRLADNPDCPIPKARLYELARNRAAQDSESAPWLPAEVVTFEQTVEAAPSTSKDLQRVAIRRLDDMQHDLLHADFAQGATVAELPDENAKLGRG